MSRASQYGLPDRFYDVFYLNAHDYPRCTVCLLNEDLRPVEYTGQFFDDPKKARELAAELNAKAGIVMPGTDK